jgi:hypothetical protein
MEKLRGSLTYANVMATLAVFLVLAGGTALAAGAFTGKQKKQVGRIAGKVFDSRIGGASVNHADTAAKATEATKANSATSASKAVDAEKFGGRVPAEYQRKLKAGCLPPSAIAGISNEGDVTCAFPVVAISSNPVAGENRSVELGNGLRLLTVCHDGGNVELAFQNVGGATAGVIGWIWGASGGATAGQEALAAGSGEKDFGFLGSVAEARIVYSISNDVTTIDVDARDLTSSCEVRGTLSSVTS